MILDHCSRAACVQQIEALKGELANEQERHRETKYEWEMACERYNALKAQAVEPRYTWGQVFSAANIAKSDCKNATGMREKIDMFVNVTRIAHDVCGTDTTPSTPAAKRPDRRAAMQMALEMLELCNKNGWKLADYEGQMGEAITALREALK